MDKIDRFTYAVFAARNFSCPEESNLRNQAFGAWHDLWTQVYQEKNSDFKLSTDEFIRQDLVCAILDQGQVAALHLYSFFDLESKADVSCKYFNFFNKNYMDHLSKLRVRSVMSMEFLTVLPQYRKSIVGFSVGSLICELGTRVFAASGADAIIAPARNDVKVNEIAYDIGFRCLEKDTQQRGFQCDLITCIQGEQKRSDIPNISNYADQLWLKKNILPSAQKFLSRSIGSLAANQELSKTG